MVKYVEKSEHSWTFHFSSVHFSQSVVSESLWPHESQHTRPNYPSPTPGVHSNSCPSSWWWHPDISSSVVPFPSFPQFLPESESFPMSQLFTWSGQSNGVSALASFLPKNTQDWSSEWTGWISLQSKGLSRVFSNTAVQKHQLEKETATHSSTLAWRFPRTEDPGRLHPMGSQRVGHDWATSLSLSQPSSQSNFHIHTWPLEKP